MRYFSGVVGPRQGYVLLGLLCIGGGTSHFLLSSEGFSASLEALMIWMLGLLVIYTAYQLPGRKLSTRGQWRALWIGVGITIAFTLLAGAVWLTWSIDAENTRLSFLLTFAAALGASVGTRSGLYAIESEERLTQSEQLTKLLRINQRVLRHNLRNELSIVLGHLENVETADDIETVRDDFVVMREHLEALSETTDRTRRLVSIWEGDTREELDLTTVVQEVVTTVHDTYPEADISVDLPEECRIQVHSAFPLAVDEAVTNALEHNRQGVAVTVSVESREKSVTLEITDTGTGIPKYDREAIHQPEETSLYHTQGLGLWQIFWTVEMSDGKVRFLENEPQGTILRITLPKSTRPFRPSWW